MFHKSLRSEEIFDSVLAKKSQENKVKPKVLELLAQFINPVTSWCNLKMG